MIRNKEQIINTLRIAKNLNSPENDTNARYSFDITTIDSILLYCHSDEIIQNLNVAKQRLIKRQEKSSNKDNCVMRIRLKNQLIDKILLELGDNYGSGSI